MTDKINERTIILTLTPREAMGTGLALRYLVAMAHLSLGGDECQANPPYETWTQEARSLLRYLRMMVPDVHELEAWAAMLGSALPEEAN